MTSKWLKYPFIDGCNDLPKDKDENLTEIRKWLETQPQLPKLNEEFLHLFLHCNYYDLEEAKSNILAYFSLRYSSPEIFSERSLSDPKILNGLKNHFFGLAPKKTPEGYQVFYVALNEKNQRNFANDDFIRTMFMFFDVMISEYGLCPGYIAVFDSNGFNLPIFLKLNFGHVMKVAKYFQEAAPVRVKNVIHLNAVSFVDKILSVCRPFLKSTIINKIQLYASGSDLTDFYKTVPRECVFEEYGGTAGSIKAAHENFKRLLETKYSQWIENQSIYEVEAPKKAQKSEKRSFFSFW